MPPILYRCPCFAIDVPISRDRLWGVHGAWEIGMGDGVACNNMVVAGWGEDRCMLGSKVWVEGVKGFFPTIHPS